MMTRQEIPLSQRTRRGSSYTFYNSSGTKRTINQPMSVDPREVRGLPIRLNLEYVVYKFCMHTALRLWILGDNYNDNDDCISDGGRSSNSHTSGYSDDSSIMPNCVLFKEYDRHAHLSDSNKDEPVQYPRFPQIFSDEVVHNTACENGVATETEIHANCPTCHEKAKAKIEEMTNAEVSALIEALAGVAAKVDAESRRSRLRREQMIDMLAKAERRLTFPLMQSKGDLQRASKSDLPIMCGI